jgi:hypothetical protein
MKVIEGSTSDIALGLIAIVEVPQLWSQWHPSVSTYRGGDWPDMEQSYRIASAISWGESMAFAGLVSWIIGQKWPLYGAIALCLVAQFFYGWFVHHPAPGNPRFDENATKKIVLPEMADLLAFIPSG